MILYKNKLIRLHCGKCNSSRFIECIIPDNKTPPRANGDNCYDII